MGYPGFRKAQALLVFVLAVLLMVVLALPLAG